MPGVVLQVAPHLPHDQPSGQGPRYGLTVSKRVGNAVVRNRTRRRLRAVAEYVLPNIADPSNDYVLIGRKLSNDRKFAALKQDVEHGLRKLGATRPPDDPNPGVTDRNSS